MSGTKIESPQAKRKMAQINRKASMAAAEDGQTNTLGLGLRDASVAALAQSTLQPVSPQAGPQPSRAPGGLQAGSQSKQEKDWQGVTMTITPNEESQTVTVKLRRKKRRYVKSNRYSKRVSGQHAGDQNQLVSNPIKLALACDEAGVRVHLTVLEKPPPSTAEVGRHGRRSAAMGAHPDLGAPRQSSSLQARADSSTLPVSLTSSTWCKIANDSSTSL